MELGSLLSPMFEAFTTLYDALFLPLGEFISEHAGGLSWLVDLLSKSFLGQGMLQSSLGVLLLGTGMLTVLVIAVVYFFIP